MSPTRVVGEVKILDCERCGASSQFPERFPDDLTFCAACEQDKAAARAAAVAEVRATDHADTDEQEDA